MLSCATMLRIFQHVLEPTRTLPFDPYRWRRDNRSAGEKVASGLRLGFGLVAGFLVLGLAVGGVSTLPADAHAYGRYGIAVSWGMLCTSTVIMFWTTNRWAPYVPAFFLFPAAFKSLSVIVLGPYSHSPIHQYPTSRTEATELFAFCAVVIALTWRFVGGRPAITTLVDRLALTLFVLAAIKQVKTPYRWPPVPLFLGLSALLMAWFASRWKSAKKHSVKAMDVISQ